MPTQPKTESESEFIIPFGSARGVAAGRGKKTIRKGYRPTTLSVTRQRTFVSSLPPIGLVAGWGEFPIQVARELVSSGRGVICTAIVGHADPRLESLCDHVRWMGVGRIGGHINYFRRHGVEQVAMAGKLFKSDILYSGPVLLRHLPDWTAIRTFAPLLWGRNRDSRDDKLLTAVTNAYRNGGLDVCPATDFAPEMLVKNGQLAGPAASAAIKSDIVAGWRVAKTMGGLDIGQTVTIKDGSVIAIEAIEGTDACIERTGTLCKRGGWTMVKVSKPNQDMRFDVPTIGPQTIQKVAAAGGVAIAIEAGKTIVVNSSETMAAAAAAGIRLIALDDDSIQQPTIPIGVRSA